ncbi:bzip transcription factor [Ophiostoma piceae UAMH 11346]|uniref:Bzip transcription factor n=1 Tax=Ophiostoma piceae (strain UAMH 11346) TaxID=1262450 RepID=S3BVF5_OPHP1|nr:bzip transcription factor [Ophiostoma piceae UAMH 11346]
MKHEKHSSSGRGGDSKRSKGKDTHGKPRHGESTREGYYGKDGYYPPMESAYHSEQQPYPHQYSGHYQQEHQHQQGYYSQSAPPASSASAGPSLSAILNHGDPADDYPRHISTYPSAGTSAPAPAPASRLGSSGSMGSNGASSKMALHNALSPIVPSTPSMTASGPVDNSIASVALSDQRSVTSASDVTYTSHTQAHPQTYRTHDGHPMYASAEDFQKGKANLDYHYYHTHSSNNSDSYLHEHEQYTTSSRGTEADRRASGSSRSSKHHNAAASYTSELPSRGPPTSSRGDTGKKPSAKSGSSSKGKKEQKGQRSQTGQKSQNINSHYHNSHLYAATPTSSTEISSPAFSAPDTPGQQTPRLVSVGNGSFGSSGGEGEYYDQDQDQDHDEDDEDDASSYGARGRDRDASSAPSLQQPPAVQRERNRVAATKCRAKSKAAVSKLEEEERLMSDQRQSLVAQKSALVDEMLNLREQLLLHGSCESGGFIKQYITNAAHTIADSGGKKLIWGADGTGKAWGDERHHSHGHGHGHDQSHDHDHGHDGHSKGHVKKEKKKK